MTSFEKKMFEAIQMIAYAVFSDFAGFQEFPNAIRGKEHERML